MRIYGKSCATGRLVTVSLEDQRIATVESGAPADAAGVLGGDNVWIAPGWMDLQLNGYGGYDFNNGLWTDGEIPPDTPARIAELMARAGQTTALPTIVTNSREEIASSLRTLARALDADRALEHALPAIHLEGPYISSEDGARGAHPLEHVRDPDWDEFQGWQDAGGGRIKIVTLAAERQGALAFIERAAAAGLVVSLGHTAATPAQIRDAVAAGARMSTHLGNGSHAMLPRHSNYLWEQAASDELTAGIIADGHHLPPSMVKCFARLKGAERLCLVSDAVALGGQPAGIYGDGRYEVLPSGKVVLAGTPYLAGAGHLLDVCLANALRWTDLGMSGVMATVTSTPAHLLGWQSKGSLAPGFDADLTLFRVPETNGAPDADGPLEIVATVRGGQIVYQA
jgi:N-acetylglucosamine-6-phosphate deacetylase